MERNGLKVDNIYIVKYSFTSPFGYRAQIGERMRYKGNYNFEALDDYYHYNGDPRNVTLNDEDMQVRLIDKPVCSCGNCEGQVRPTHVGKLGDDGEGELEKDWMFWMCDNARRAKKNEGFLVDEPM